MAVLFSRRLRVRAHGTTLGMRVRALVISYPKPTLLIAGFLLLALVTRTAALAGLAVFPLVGLARASIRDGEVVRKLGLPTDVSFANVPEVALVSAGERGLSVEGLNITLSRASLVRGMVDRAGRVIVETKRDLPNFTFTVEDADEARALLAALGFGDEPDGSDASPAAPSTEIPALLRRGDIGVEVWVDALRSGAAGGYRSAGLAPDALWRALEDAEAPLGVRAAAAVALGPSLDKAGRKRFLEIKSDAPYPLRVVLKVARTADIAAIVKALTRCCADEEST